MTQLTESLKIYCTKEEITIYKFLKKHINRDIYEKKNSLCPPGKKQQRENFPAEFSNSYFFAEAPAFLNSTLERIWS